MKKLITSLLCSFTLSLSAGEMLNLSSASGQQIQAELVEVSKGIAVLKTSSGSLKKIPIKKFSAESIALLKAEYEKLKDAPNVAEGEAEKSPKAKTQKSGKIEVDGLLAEPFQLTHTEIVPKGANFAAASFVLYSDIDLKKITSILILCPIMNGSADIILANQKWLNTAKKLNSAILIPAYINQDLDNLYSNMNKQSGQAFDKAIKQLAFKSKLSTFNQLPFIVWGSSVGGSMAHGIASLYPEKTLACVANIKSTDKVETKCKKKKDLQAVPCLFITGSRDPSTAKHAPEIQDLYESNRNKKAPWALAACPESHGKSTAAENLAIRFFEAVVPLRRPKMGSKLTDVSTLADVWSGNNETHEVQQGPGEKQDSWLPNEEFAQYWNKNHKGGGMKH